MGWDIGQNTLTKKNSIGGNETEQLTKFLMAVQKRGGWSVRHDRNSATGRRPQQMQKVMCLHVNAVKGLKLNKN